jgi:DNA-binding transcriptional regulator GbsR (MarR family)
MAESLRSPPHASARAPVTSPNLAAARREFVDLWGQMAAHWGINRTMSQIHALLMVSHEPMTAEQIMEELQSSRGNVSMNLRELTNWGIVRRTSLPGDRRDFFTTEADVWTMFQIILRERKKRELDPLLSRLEECLALAGKKPEGKAVSVEDKAGHETYVKRVTELRDFFSTFHRLFSVVLDNQPGSLAKAAKVIEKLV